MALLLTAVGVQKGEEFSDGALFIVDTTWPQGSADNRITSSLTDFHKTDILKIKTQVYDLFYFIDT